MEDAEKLAKEEIAFAREEVEKARKAVERVENAFQEHEKLPIDSLKEVSFSYFHFIEKSH